MSDRPDLDDLPTAKRSRIVRKPTKRGKIPLWVVRAAVKKVRRDG